MESWEQMEPKKTTPLNLISHFMRPDEGQILLDDQVQSTDFYQYIGFLSQHFSYYENFTGLNFLLYMATLKGMPKRQAQKRPITCSSSLV